MTTKTLVGFGNVEVVVTGATATITVVSGDSTFRIAMPAAKVDAALAGGVAELMKYVVNPAHVG